VELLVNNAELEPDVLVKQVTQLVYAVGAKQEEARTLTRQMFSHVLATRAPTMTMIWWICLKMMIENKEDTTKPKKRQRTLRVCKKHWHALRDCMATRAPTMTMIM
jgi:hypothetical protein